MLSLIILCLCISSSVFSKEINNHNSLNLTTTATSKISSSEAVTATTTTTSERPVIEGHQHHDPVVHDAKSDSDGERQLCPTCGGSDCNTNMTISGLPIIQVIIALGVGILWAKIFIWLFKNFYEKGNSEHEPQPQYGVPQSQYGVPQSTYGVQSTYGSPSSQSSRALNTDFLTLTQNVWKAVKDFSESWGENAS